MKCSKQIAYYAYEVNGDWSLIAEKIKRNDVPKEFELNEKFVTIVDENYPYQLRQLRYPPWILFYEGDLSLVNRKCVSIIGSRMPTFYGNWMTEEICKKLIMSNVLVSGLAKGIDAKVHETAILYGNTIGVIGCGLGSVYPKENGWLYEEMRKNHLILSEYPFHVKVMKHHFPWRNRIIAALSKVCIVTQAKIKSGTMLTVNEAITLSKDVYVVPYPLGEFEGEGCNLLIQQGAQIITSIKDLDI